MVTVVQRTPETSLKEVFLAAAADLPEDNRSEVVADALGHLQRGFDAHYAAPGGATDDSLLVGDNSYAWAVETIACLDEPEFVAVASRMIRDGAGSIAAGGEVSLELWVPHLAGLLNIISEEGLKKSQARIRLACGAVRPAERWCRG